MRALFAQFTRFGVVGLVGLVIDIALFNLLRLTIFSPELVAEGPLLAKACSTGVAIVANWIGNRYWTFRAHRGRQLWREFAEFVTVSLGGMAIGLLCLWISHYVLGFTSVLADNIASNVVGLALGTAFRFTFYRLWVFAPRRGEPVPVFPEVRERSGADSVVSDRPDTSSRRAGATAPAGDASPSM